MSSNEPFALNEYQSFELLVEDLHAVFENVAPVAAHDGVYSHRIYEILLRACTEFESVCKELLEKQGEIVARPTMGNYLPVLGKYVQPELQVGLFFWSPKRFVSPFERDANGQFKWYAAYNAVKHNRKNLFESASLENAVLAVAALFAILYKVHGEDFFSQLGDGSVRGSGSTEYSERWVVGWPFSVRERR